MVALGHWTRGRKGETDRDRGSGGVQGSSFTLRENQIASGSRYPPLYSSVFQPSPPLLVFLFLSFHSSSHLDLFGCFFFAPLLIFSHSLSLFWLLWQLVLLGGNAQGGDVCGEAVFKQDTSVPLAVQLSDEAVPVNHEARTEPAVQKTERNKRRALVSASSLTSRRVPKKLSMSCCQNSDPQNGYSCWLWKWTYKTKEKYRNKLERWDTSEIHLWEIRSRRYFTLISIQETCAESKKAAREIKISLTGWYTLDHITMAVK